MYPTLIHPLHAHTRRAPARPLHVRRDPRSASVRRPVR